MELVVSKLAIEEIESSKRFYEQQQKNLLKIFLFFVSVMYLYATPSWYYKLSSTSSNLIVGYGSGEDEAKAKQEAFNDIAGKISTNVTTSLNISQSVKDDYLEQNSNYTTSQKADAILNDYKLLKMEYMNGNYYVAVEYENIPSIDKFTNKLKKFKLINEKQNSYIKNTYLAKEIKKALGIDVDFKLFRKDKKWFLKYKNITQILDKKDFAKLFTSVENKDIKINTNKKRDILYDGDKFYFKVKSSKKAYISVITVYEDGTVATLVRNISIGKNKLEKIPDEDFETIPEAGLIHKGIETYDLNVAILSDRKLHFDRFAYADSSLVNEEKYKNFDELIEFLDDKTFATIKVVTKPR